MKNSNASTHLHRNAWKKSSLALAVMLACCGGIAVDASAAQVSIAGATQLLKGDQVLGALPMAQPMHIEVALTLRDRAGLDALIADNAKLQGKGLDPHLLTPEQFLANHAPTASQAQAVADYLTSRGFRNVTIAPNRLLVSADGTAANARDAFATTFAQIKTGDGRIAFANTIEARIPAALSDSVIAVLGLQNVHIAHSFARRFDPGKVHTQIVTGHDPADFATIYGANGGAAATNVVVGIVSEGDLTQTMTDLNIFKSEHSFPAFTTSIVNTNGTSTDSANTGEWDLDSQDILGISGGVKQLIFYNIPSLSNADLTADFNTIVTANKTKIINVSLGECENFTKSGTGDGSAAADDVIFANAVALGQTFSISTGDSGADECGNATNTPSWPAASQYVIAAAGTTLDTTGTTYNSETSWIDSGGSPSTFEPIPSWQHNFPIAGTKRIVADVAFDADPNSGADIIVNNLPAQFGGTSLSAPLFAGAWARQLQVRAAIGFAGPVIYDLVSNVFKDVTSGTNSGGESGIGFTAKAGYDDATGRGSIIIFNLLADSPTLGNQPPVANFSYVTNGQTVNFTDMSTDPDNAITLHAWKFGDGFTSSSANPSHTYAQPGTYSVIETVQDKIGAGRSKTESVIVGPHQLLANTGFETGVATPWALTTGILTNNASLAHAGNWLLAIGGGATAHSDHAAQAVSIQSGHTTATLSFFVHTITSDMGAVAHDKMTVGVYNSGGVLLSTLATYSNLDASSGYVQHNLDMSSFIGQTVTVKFVGTNGATLPTTWYVDDVTLTEQ